MVDDPASGDSVGSRVMLGTLGHHGNWRYAGQSIDVQQWDVQVPELPTLGGTGLVTLAGVYGLLNPSCLDGQSDQDLSRTEKVQRHPGMALSVAGLLLSVVAMTLLTPVGTYNLSWLWSLDTNYLVFTAVSSGLSLDFVLAAVTLLGWALVPVGLCLESRRGKRLLPVVPRVSQTTVAGSLPIWYSLLGVLWLVGFVTVETTA